MVSVPYSERRHRLRGDELQPVKEAVHRDLLKRIDARDDLLLTACLFRAWYRMETYCRNKPAYPPHETWSEIKFYIDYGTVTPTPESLDYGTITPQIEATTNGTESPPTESPLDVAVKMGLHMSKEGA